VKAALLRNRDNKLINGWDHPAPGIRAGHARRPAWPPGRGVAGSAVRAVFGPARRGDPGRPGDRPGNSAATYRPRPPRYVPAA